MNHVNFHSTKDGGQLNIRIMGLTTIPDAAYRITLIHLMSLSNIKSIFLIHPQKSQSEWRNVFYLCGGFTLAGTVVFGLMAVGEVEPWATEVQDSDVIPAGGVGDVIGQGDGGDVIKQSDDNMKAPHQDVFSEDTGAYPKDTVPHSHMIDSRKYGDGLGKGQTNKGFSNIE